MDLDSEDPLDPGFADQFSAEKRPPCQLYLISPPSIDAHFGERLKVALSAGPVAAFQLRLKGIDDHEIAKRLGADGVHLGQDDGDPREARDILGRDAQIGVTCHNSRHLAMEAGEKGADYVAFGAFYPSDTKEVKYIADKAILGWWTTLFGTPCVAIGGITPFNARPLVDAGADFVATSAAVWQAEGGEASAVKAFAAVLTNR
jgi:thiamine-phosphate pyrophosphorylase